MVQVDRYLSSLTRKLPRVRGMARLIRPLRGHYARKYADREDRSVAIDDYDGDVKMIVDRSTYIGGSIYWLGYHHRQELDYLGKILKPGMTFVDIGANQGEFTLFAARRLSQGNVFAFEPEEQMFQRLTKNVDLNQFKNVKLFNCGLGKEKTWAQLYTSRDTALHSGWHEGLFTSYRSNYRNDHVQDIEIIRFDEILSNGGVQRVDLVKIDVEGAELFVLQGAEETLRRFKPKILLEMNEETFRHAGYSAADVMKFMHEHGYHFFKFLRNGKLQKVDPLKEGNQSPNYNVLCQ